MICNQYLGVRELEEIKNACEALTKMYETVVGITEFITLDDDIWSMTHKVYDCNGELLGHIAMTDGGGYGFYFDDEVVVS